MQTHYKETATFLYTYYFSCHTLKGVHTGFAKGEALHLLRPNSSRSTFNKKRTDFQICLKELRILKIRFSGVIFYGRDSILENKENSAHT